MRWPEHTTASPASPHGANHGPGKPRAPGWNVGMRRAPAEGTGQTRSPPEPAGTETQAGCGPGRGGRAAAPSWRVSPDLQGVQTGQILGKHWECIMLGDCLLTATLQATSTAGAPGPGLVSRVGSGLKWGVCTTLRTLFVEKSVCGGGGR